MYALNHVNEVPDNPIEEKYCNLTPYEKPIKRSQIMQDLHLLQNWQLYLKRMKMLKYSK